MLAKIVTFAALTVSAVAFAQSGTATSSKISENRAESAIGEGSALLGQPKAGRVLINVGPAYATSESASKSTYNGRDSHSNSSSETKLMSLDAKTGLSDAVAIGLQANYGQGVWSYRESKSVDEGLDSPSAYLQARLPQEGMALIGRLSLTPNAFEHKCEYSSATKTTTCDRYNGGSSATLNLGAETKGTNILGVMASANFLDLRTTKYQSNQSAPQDDHYSGGNSYGLALYGERSLGDHRLGLAVLYSHNTATESSSNSSRYINPYYDFGTAQVYGRLRVAKNVDVQPSVNYMRILNQEIGGSTINYYNSYTFQVGAIIGL
jgi:hypothetical protein